MLLLLLLLVSSDANAMDGKTTNVEQVVDAEARNAEARNALLEHSLLGDDTAELTDVDVVETLL